MFIWWREGVVLSIPWAELPPYPYIVNWRINKLLFSHNLYSGAFSLSLFYWCPCHSDQMNTMEAPKKMNMPQRNWNQNWIAKTWPMRAPRAGATTILCTASLFVTIWYYLIVLWIQSYLSSQQQQQQWWWPTMTSPLQIACHICSLSWAYLLSSSIIEFRKKCTNFRKFAPLWTLQIGHSNDNQIV